QSSRTGHRHRDRAREPQQQGFLHRHWVRHPAFRRRWWRRRTTSITGALRMTYDPTNAPSRPLEQVLYEVKKVIVGQDALLERLIVALLARGHVLVEGVPGLAKTMAIKTLAASIGGEFKRVQFTPDLVPADLTGTRIYNQRSGEFQTSLGPVFTNLLLA